MDKCKKACVNINNDENTCFEYSVKCGWYNIHAKTNPQRLGHYNDDNLEIASVHLTVVNIP